MENGEPKPVTLDDLATMVAKGFADVEQKLDAVVGAAVGDLRSEVNKRIDTLSYKVDQLDGKFGQHHQESKDGFDAMKRIMGGMSRTLTDHEERIKALEGE